MIRKRIGSLTALLFFLAILTGAVIYEDLSASDTDDPYQAIKLLNETIHQVSDKYVDSVETDSLYMRALNGMLESLDPYSQLLTPSDYKDLRIHTQGNYEGLGIQIDVRDDLLTIVAPIEGTPAYQQGLLAGDRILEVDGVSTRGWSQDKAVTELRGPKGSSVTLTIGREGRDDTFPVTITREPITLSSVPYSFMVRDGIGYVRFRQFSERGREEIRQAVRDLEKEGLRGLILDLRNNPGGLLDQAIDVTDLFLPKGAEIVSTRGRMNEADRTYAARDNDDFSTHPTIVLVDRASASASEILAGALQDHDRALIVGQATWGKGLVQSLFPLDDGYFLKLTTARYYTPSGRSIQRDPDSPVDFSDLGLPDEFGMFDETDLDIPDSLLFETDMGRTVYGGGGVMPDVLIQAEDLDELSQKLIREIWSNTGFFSFAVNYRADHPEISRTFVPDDDVLEDFRTYLSEEKGLDFSDRAFDAERDYLRDYLQYTMISQYHGEGAARQAVMNADLPLAKAVELLTEADTLADLFRLAQRERAAMREAAESTQTASAGTSMEYPTAAGAHN